MSQHDELNVEQTKALAAFLTSLRPDWNHADTAAVLWNARDRAPIRDLTCAAVGAACDENTRAPAVIDRPGQHWRHRTADVRPDFDRPDDNRRCSVCYLAFDDCRARWRQDHEFLSILDTREQSTPPPEGIRAAIHDATDNPLEGQA